MIINGKNYDLNQIAEALSKKELGIDGTDKLYESLFNLFDENNNGKLDAEEIRKIYNIFQENDNEEISKGVLTEKEQTGIALEFSQKNMFSKKWDINLLGINKNTLLDFFTKLADANTSKIIDKILTVESAEDASRCISINGVNHSLDGIRDITVKNADFINKDNVLNLINVYFEKTETNIGNTSLKMSDTFFSNIDNLKTYICKPLAEKAKEMHINFDYENINDTRHLALKIKEIKREIENSISNSCTTEVNEGNSSTRTTKTLIADNKKTVTSTIKDKDGNLLSEIGYTSSLSESGIVTVKSSRKSYNKDNVRTAEISYQYSIDGIEEYIIKNSRNNMYANIKEIREKQKFKIASPEELTLLKQFDTMVSSIINAGNEYGVDPNLIVSIIRQETTFDGMNDAWCTGKNGKGYMQLTSAPIEDYLNKYSENIGGKQITKFAKKNKDNYYGWEMQELLESRGFNVKQDEKKALVKEIMKFLKNNDDADFNIRLGTLVLRYYQNQKGGKNGNSRLAAYHYNGNPALQQAYARNVERFQAELRDTIPEQERLNRTYSFQITSLEA